MDIAYEFLLQRILSLEAQMQQVRGGKIIGTVANATDANTVDGKHASDLKHGVSTDEDTAIKVKIGSFACPTATGNYSVTGVGFKPRCVEFQVVRELDNEARTSLGQMDYQGNQTAFGTATDGTLAKQHFNLTLCIRLVAASGTTEINAEYVSMDSDGFTIKFNTVQVASYSTIIWIAMR